MMVASESRVTTDSTTHSLLQLVTTDGTPGMRLDSEMSIPGVLNRNNQIR
jgi:hypothetical protein